MDIREDLWQGETRPTWVPFIQGATLRIRHCQIGQTVIDVKGAQWDNMGMVQFGNDERLSLQVLISVKNR